jgi:hypothetical protein
LSLQQLKKMNRLMMAAGSEMRQAKRSRKFATASRAPCVIRNYPAIATHPPKAVTRTAADSDTRSGQRTDAEQ